MARTKGAKDNRPRKQPTRKKAVKKVTAKRAAPRPATKPAAEKVQADPDALAAAIHGELTGNQTNSEQVSTGGTDGPQIAQGGAPSLPAETDLGIKGWQAMLMTPFRVLAFWFDCEAVEKIGADDVPEIAAPSYVLYRHYSEKWLAMNPDDPLAVAKMATAGVLVGTAMKVYAAISAKAAERKKAAPKPPPKSAVTPAGEVPEQTWQQDVGQ